MKWTSCNTHAVKPQSIFVKQNVPTAINIQIFSASISPKGVIVADFHSCSSIDPLADLM